MQANGGMAWHEARATHGWRVAAKDGRSETLPYFTRTLTFTAFQADALWLASPAALTFTVRA